MGPEENPLRMRQHVNPLSRFFQIPRELPSPSVLFQNANLPIHLDIGCARGRFLLKAAQIEPNWNYLGIEIRQSLVEAAESDRHSLGITNLHYLFCNANTSLKTWLYNLPPGQVQYVSIQFPDPWFKKKHFKRRILQPDFLLSIAATLRKGHYLFFQSDVKAIIDEMIYITNFSGYFDLCSKSINARNKNNPLIIPTERERYVLSQGLPIYRALFKRNKLSMTKSNFDLF